jgi:preprotein translocase subunit SecD
MSREARVVLTAAVIAAAIGAGIAIIGMKPTPHPGPVKPVRLDFYWLKGVESERNPAGKWEMLEPERDEKSGTDVYAFKNKATGKVVKGDTAKGREQILLKVANAYDPVKNPKGLKPILTARDLKPVCKGDLEGNNFIIIFELKPRGAKVFADFTRRHVGDIVAIFVGGRILTAPRIKTVIAGWRGEIEGFMSLEEAQQRAEQLNAAALNAATQSPDGRTRR